MTTSDHGARGIDLERRELGRYRATNARGGTVDVGSGEDDEFTPVELLLVALAACSAVDVDHIVSKRAEPTRMVVGAAGRKIRDEQGNRMTDLTLAFDLAFGKGADGDRARAVLADAIAMSHDRLCTVSRTVEVGTRVDAHAVGEVSGVSGE